MLELLLESEAGPIIATTLRSAELAAFAARGSGGSIAFELNHHSKKKAAARRANA